MLVPVTLLEGNSSEPGQDKTSRNIHEMKIFYFIIYKAIRNMIPKVTHRYVALYLQLWNVVPK